MRADPDGRRRRRRPDARSRPWSRRSGTVLPPGAVVVNKSTVPVGTAARTAELLGARDVAVVSNPEFLREGSGGARLPAPRPDRRRLATARTPPSGWPRSTPGSARRRCSPTRASAEMIKYAANCFLAMKLSYVNALAELCERLGRRRRRRHRGAWATTGASARRSSRPGPGWGGSCLPKDTARAAAGRRLGRLRVPAAARRDRHQHAAAPADRGQGPAGGHRSRGGLAGPHAARRCSG